MTVTRAVTVAAGVFAPGHLGELTWQVPFELADAVLEETRTRERRLRLLPSRVGVYFVLALGLFPGLGYQNVWAKLTAALDGQGVPCPSAKALRDLRRRLGAAPLKGTKVGFTPSMELSSRHVKCVIEPTPACAMFSVSAFAFT